MLDRLKDKKDTVTGGEYESSHVHPSVNKGAINSRKRKNTQKPKRRHQIDRTLGIKKLDLKMTKRISDSAAMAELKITFTIL